MYVAIEDLKFWFSDVLLALTKLSGSRIVDGKGICAVLTRFVVGLSSLNSGIG